MVYGSALVRSSRLVSWLLPLTMSMALGACNHKPASRMKVAVTIFPIYDLARRIAGQDADVVLLVPVGRSEVDFVPSSRETQAATGTKLGIMVGLGLDDWMPGLLDGAAPGARRLAVGDRVPTLAYRPNPIALALQGPPEKSPYLEGKPDPHVWLDPSRAELLAKAIAEEMARTDPPRAAGYRHRSAELMQDLEGLDHEVELRVASWGNRSFVPLRPDFAYFAERYHLDIPAVLVASPGVAPPSARYEQEVVKDLRAQGVTGVFREPQLAPDTANFVGEAAGVPVGVLDALGGGEQTDTYDKLIRFDADALEKLLFRPESSTILDAGRSAYDAGWD
jgi:zinc transport system substrate-binding protein